MTEPFAIATLSAGRGTLAICPLPGRGGDLAGDVARIVALAPDLVITMTETTEMAALGAAALPDLLARAGIDWHHFPIRDFGVPQDGADWPALSARARAILANGGTVLAHCRGGLGRSGMVLLRLLVDMGAPPGPSLARLRSVRPGAVETAEQERWASGL